MASPPEPNCAQAIAQDDPPRHQIPSDKDNQPRSADQRDYDFVEQPSQDFFCPVTLELLLEPQLTSCCGHHLSLEASSRLQREGKACPLCNETGWSTMLDKFHRRKVHELRVRCPHRGSGCDWVGEVNSVERHAGCCPKRAWECQYCGLKCTYGEGEGEHWPTCSKFPEPCPNGCEVGSVERCNVEQHRTVCSLEPVCCEMREFGCSAVVPRKDLAMHMRESELQHLTGMAVLNLRLARQLQQDLAEKDKKIAQLQQEMAEQRQLQKKEFTEQKKWQTEMRKEMTEQKQEMIEEMLEQRQLQKKEFAEQKKEFAEQKYLQSEMKKEMTEQRQLVKKEFAEQKHLQTEMKKEMTEQRQLQTKMEKEIMDQKREMKEELTELRGQVQQVHTTTQHIEVHTAGPCGLCKVVTFDQYSQRKGIGGNNKFYSDPFYSHQHGYKFKLRIRYFSSQYNDIGAELHLLTGEYDDQLPWPVNVTVRLELLNQAGDHHHVERTKTWEWEKAQNKENVIDHSLMKYSDLEKRGDGVQYMMNNCLKFRLHLTVQPA